MIHLDTTSGRRLGCLAAWFVLVAVACSPPDPPSDTGQGDVWSVDSKDSTDPDDTADQEEGDTSGDLALDLGSYADGGDSYDPYPDDGAEIELVHGFQGGYHIEPSLFLTGISRAEFSATIRYAVERISDGEKLNRRDTYEVDQYGWLEYEAGYLHHSNPVVFETRQPDEVVGDEIRLRVTVDIESGGEVTDTQTGTLSDGGSP